MLLHLGGDADLAIVKPERVVDLRQMLGLEFHVEHRSDDLDDPADVMSRD
jgi:hypothetical protein